MEHSDLYFLRQRGGKPLNVQLLSVQPHGLNEELMPLLVGEPLHFGLNGGAVPGAHPLDGTVIERGAVQIGSNDLMGGMVGVGEVADRPVFRGLVRLEGEGQSLPVPCLKLHFGKIHTAGVHSGGRTRLEAADGQTQAE